MEETLKINIGSMATVLIPYISASLPTAVWTRDGSLFDDGDTVLTRINEEAVELIFNQVTLKDAASYALKLSTEQGQCSYAIKVIVIDKPGSPRDLKVTKATDTAVTLTWSPPDYDGGATVTGYLIESRLTESEDWLSVGSMGCLEVTVDSLVTGSSYYFRVAAENQCGVGEFIVLDGLVTLQPPGVKPWFVRKLPSRFEIVADQSFSLVCYTGRKGYKPTFVKKLPAKMETQRGINFEAECTIGQVVEENATGLLQTSKVERKISQEQKGKPLAPAGLRITDVGSTSVCIEWDSPLDIGGSPIIHYILEKREAGQAQWEPLTNLPPDINECELENMISNKGYYLRIFAENQYGVSPPQELSEAVMVTVEDIDPPTKPQNLQIKKLDEFSIELTWDLSTSGPEAPVLHYIIEGREMRGPRWVRVHKVAVDAPPYVMQNLVEGSEYEFQVFARNCAGLSEPSGMSKQLKCGAETMTDPARFLVELQDVMVDAGSKAEFECTIAGKPHPQVKWFKNLREIFDGYRHKISQENDKCHLVFNNVGQDDCGEVECRIYNSEGMAVSRAQLSISIPAQLMLTPRFLHGLSFTQGQSMKIHVPVHGRPMPDVTWFKDGEVISGNERRVVVVEDGSVVLQVTECNRLLDNGQYSLRVKNGLGTDQATFQVTITDRPGPPEGKPVAKQISSDSCQLDWVKPIDDGGASVTSYLVERRDSPITKSGTDGDIKGTEAGVDEKWQSVGSTHFTHMIVYRLKEDVKYQFRVRAENAHGFSDNSEESDWIVLQQCSSQMDYDALVCPEVTPVFRKFDVSKLKGESELNNKHIICEELGRGPFGVIHRAIERSTGKNYLAKFVVCTTIERSMIRQEIEIMSELNHHSLQHLHEAFETKGEMAFILEFLSGSDFLTRILESGSTYSELDCIHWLRELCQGVAYMHKNNFIHLDIRADNVYFTTSKGQDIKLLNFGIAQRVDPNRTVRILFNTIEHCSPEVLTFAPVSFASDMWSIGVLAYLLLSGVSPFLGKTTDETYLNITEGKGVSFASPVFTQVSHYAKNWIGRLVVKDVKKRMTAAEALADPWLNGEAESKINKTILPIENFRNVIARQKWRDTFHDLLPIGSLSHQGAVFLKLSQEGIAMERELFMELPDQAPEVVLELANTEAYEGTVGRFKCKFHSQPEATVQWYHEEFCLESENPKYNIWYKHGLAMLNIIDADLEDAGQYSCVATNGLGSCTTVGELNIQEHALKQLGSTKRLRSVSIERDASMTDTSFSHTTERQTSMDRSIRGGSVGGSGSAHESYSSGYGSSSAKAAPQFLLPLMDQELLVGQTCIHSVLMSCKPDIEVSWFHGQTKITTSNNYHMESDNNLFSLTIKSLSKEDSGAWRCLGVNALGQCMCVCKLDVLDEAPVDCVSPKFTQPLVKTIVMEGGAAKLECRVIGTPQPEVKWFRDRRLIADDPFYIMSCEEKEVHTLSIPAAYSEHAGWYTCQARNVAGSVTTEAKFVIERLDCESMYSTHSSFDRASLADDLESVQTRTSVASAQRRKKLLTSAPQFTARLRGKRCQEGQSVRFNCSVSGIPEPVIIWLRANGTVLHPSSRIRISNNYGLCSLEIVKVRREDEGMYIVRASNTEGEVSSSASLDVEEIKLLSTHKAKSQSFDLDWLPPTSTQLKQTSRNDSSSLCNLASQEVGGSLSLSRNISVSSDCHQAAITPVPSHEQIVKSTDVIAVDDTGSRKESTIDKSNLLTAETRFDENRTPTNTMNIQWADDSDNPYTDGSDTEVLPSDEDALLRRPLTSFNNEQKQTSCNTHVNITSNVETRTETISSTVSKTVVDVSKDIDEETSSNLTVIVPICETVVQAIDSSSLNINAVDSSLKTIAIGSDSSTRHISTKSTAADQSVVSNSLPAQNVTAGNISVSQSITAGSSSLRQCSATESSLHTQVTAKENRLTTNFSVETTNNPIQSASAESFLLSRSSETENKVRNQTSFAEPSSSTSASNDNLCSPSENATHETNSVAETLASINILTSIASSDSNSRPLFDTADDLSDSCISSAQLVASISSAVDNLDNLPDEEEDGTSPVFESLLKDQVVAVLGSEARFTCHIKSEKRCTVVWLKDGMFITGRENMTTESTDDGRYTLMISNVHVADAGEYTIDAMNIYGSVSCSAVLTILEESSSTGRVSTNVDCSNPESTNEKSKSGGRRPVPPDQSSRQGTKTAPPSGQQDAIDIMKELTLSSEHESSSKIIPEPPSVVESQSITQLNVMQKLKVLSSTFSNFFSLEYLLE